MHIKLAYGTNTVPIDVPDNWINGRCVRPNRLSPSGDGRAELISALSALGEEMRLETILNDKSHCLIVVDPESEIVRTELLHAFIELIEDASTLVPHDITILVANRLLDPYTKADLPKLLSADVIAEHPVVLHDFNDDDAMVDFGETSKKLPVFLNKAYKNAEVKFILGGVRPDIFAGFSGGRSVVLPGIAGKKTVQALFDFNNIANANSRVGNFRDNPFHIAGMEVLNLAGCDLAINAVMTPEGALHRVTAGHFGQSHLAAMTILKEGIAVKVKEPMDIIVTSGGGSPYDDTLLSLLTTLAAVRPALKPEGTIVITGALEGGIGPKDFEEAVKSFPSVNDAMTTFSMVRDFKPSYYYAQRYFALLQQHEVIIHSKGITDDVAWEVGLTPSREMNEAVLGAMESHGQRCKIAALPDGPLGLGEVGA